MRRQGCIGLLLVNGVLLLLVIVWSIPTLGLFISSFRARFDIQTSGWWTVFPHRAWETVAVSDPKELGLDPDGVMSVEGVQGTFEELREGVQSPEGDTRVTWIGNKRLGRIEVQKRVWTTSWNFTLANYEQVLFGRDTEVTKPDGTVEVVPGQDMTQAFLNSLTVAIPSTIIPILIAAFAAYAVLLSGICATVTRNTAKSSLLKEERTDFETLEEVNACNRAIEKISIIICVRLVIGNTGKNFLKIAFLLRRRHGNRCSI